MGSDTRFGTTTTAHVQGVTGQRYVGRVDADALLAGLNERQAEAVTARGGPIVVHAGAGSGKTRVLTRRIAYRVFDGQTEPARVLALTFTRKAAGELRSRLRSSGLRGDVVAGTFHGIALTQLRQRWAERGITPPAMLDSKFRFVSQLVRRQRGVEMLDVVSEIEWARARLVSPEHYAAAADLAGRTPPMPAEQFAELMERFQLEKRKRRVVDFDDLLALAIRDLHEDEHYAAGVRWRHRHLYVDEFQDVNPLQYELLRAWRGTTDDIFIVGDPNQAIYGWNGADPNLLTNFAKREPGATVIRLLDNYRSTPQVLTLANASLEGTGGQLIPHRPDGDVPTLRSYINDSQEAVGIADAVKQAKHPDTNWGDQAILVRTNAQLVAIEQALADVGIPVRVRGGAGPLSTPEVKSELRALGRDGINLRDALAQLDGSLDAAVSSDEDDDPDNDDAVAELLDPGADADADDAIEEAEPSRLGGSAPWARPSAGKVRAVNINEQERRQNLSALSRLVHEYLAIDATPSGPGLLAWIATVQANEVATTADAVELSTFHGAKGLEWPVVHVAGLEKGYVPIGYAKTGAQLAEERRLLYVAITRAEKELHLSWAAERTFGAKSVKRQPSPHLDTLQSVIDHLRRGHRPVDWRAEMVKSRAAIPKKGKGSASDKNPVDDPLFEALRAWRRDKARGADVPAYVIFNDQTLRAVAKKRPGSRAALASISGIGPAKLERFGNEVLAVVAEHAD